MKISLVPFLLFFPVLCFGLTTKERREVAEHLQDISVTIRAEDGYQKSEGSGVLVTREIDGEKVTFVWTAGHVVDHLRSVRTVVEDGSDKKLVEFNDVQIIKELVEGGRRVGEIKMDATVIKYSDADDGEDLALLMVRAKDYGKDNAKFYLNKEEPIIPIGTRLFHVGSLLGQMGANSMTSGIVAQVGRIHGKVEFDQTTVTAFPGSSGGGVFLENGEYIGMLVRGAGEGFNLIVPVRRIKRFAEKHKIMWAIDPSLPAPPLDVIKKLPVETAAKVAKKKPSSDVREFKREFPFLIRTKIFKPLSLEE
jgi:S1-C subfamily serine protease